MQTKFKSITIEGFRSIVSPLTFHFEESGLFLIKGENGVGKTTIFEALVWALFGENLKGTVGNKVATWKELRGEGWKGTKVSLEFETGAFQHEQSYMITRCLKYGSQDDLTVVVNTDPLSYEDKADLQGQINEILGLDYKLFVNSFLFGQRMAKLVSSSNTEKRKLFEDLFSMDWIDTLKTDVQKDLTEQAETVRESEKLLAGEETKLSTYREQLSEAEGNFDNTKQEIKRLEDDKKEEIVSLNEMIEKNRNTLDTIQGQIEAFDLDEEKYEKYNTLCASQEKIAGDIGEIVDEQERLERLIKDSEELMQTLDPEKYIQLGKEIQTLKDEINEICPTLGIKHEDLTDEVIHAAELLHKDRLEKVQDKTYQAGQIALQLNSKITELSNVSDNCPTCGSKLKDVEATKKEIENSINNLKANSEKPEWELLELKKQADASIIFRYREVVDLENRIKAKQDQIPENLAEKLDTWTKNVTKYQKELDELGQKKEKEGDTLDKIDKDIKELIEFVRAYEKAEDDILSLQNDIEVHERVIEDSEKDIESVENTIKALPDRLRPYSGIMNTAKDKIDKTNDEIIKLDQKYRKDQLKYEAIEWWSKRAFASNGIKAYVFKAMLDQLNQYTDKYSSALGVSIKFSLDLTKVSAPFSTICSVGDKTDKDYKEFSGGQQSRLDVVLMLAMGDLLSGMGNPISLIILDEALDGLDEEGEVALFDLVSEKAKNQAVYVITHSNIPAPLNCKDIAISSENGQTVIN